MKPIFTHALALLVLCSIAPKWHAQAQEEDQATIQLALLLDTSSSMGGLVRQAQTQLWKIVNEFAAAEQTGQKIALQVGLYEYGKNKLRAEDNYIRQILPLTNNLDIVSERLFALQANNISGGAEYAGAAIEHATLNLEWAPGNDQLKVMVVAGNESFAQGPVDFKKACPAAIAEGIIINTIFCGNYSSGVGLGWKEGAQLADGVYANIDQNQVVRYRAAPQDEKIQQLGKALNSTYLPFGTEGQRGALRQESQDRYATRGGRESVTQRSIAKASGLYSNESWDIVDAVNNGTVKLSEVKAESLPQKLRELDLEEQLELIAEQTKRRKQIKKEIATLTEQRRSYFREVETATIVATSPAQSAVADALPAPAASPLAEAANEAPSQNKAAVTRSTATRRDRTASNAKTLDNALIETLRKQAKSKGIKLDEPKK